MKILWTVNTIMPEVAKQLGLPAWHAISWVDAMSKKLANREDIQLSIVCGGPNHSIQKKQLGGIIYYIMPVDWSKVDYWDEVLKDFQPDIIHAYGTEVGHNYLLLKNHTSVPIVVSLQGILTEYAKHYYAGIDISTMIRFSQLKDLFLTTGFFSGKQDFIKRSETEKKMLRLAHYVEGRSTWDYVSSKRINPNLMYYYCPRMIREPFFIHTWNLEKMERHSLMVHQGSYPIKGLHIVFEALFLLKQKYPDVKLYVAGSNLFSKISWKHKIFQKGYVNYLKHLIKKYDLSANIIFTGFLSADEMAQRLSHINVSIMPSAIENAPNSLAEAMVVGTPIVASFVGGNMDMLEHNMEGFLYCFNEPNMLAYYVSKLFDNDQISSDFSAASRKTALERHDPDGLEKKLLKIYEDVKEDFLKKRIN